MSGQPGGTRPPRRPKRTEPSTFRPNPYSAPSSPIRRGRSSGSSEESGTGEAPTFWERIVFGRVGSGQLAQFCRQAAAYLNAGVDINKALANLQIQFGTTALGPVISRLRAAVKRGDSFAEAVGREPQAFDPMFLGMIRVAEARGGVPETLKLLGNHYEARQRLIRQARSAMIYPIIVLLLGTAVATFLALWLLPMFASMLKDIAGPGASLPLPSRVLMAFAAFLTSVGWLVIPAVFVGTPILGLWFYRTPAGKALLDRLALRVPVFGPLLRKLDTSRFARSLAALLDAGVDVGASLDLVTDIVRLDPYRQALRAVRTEVLHGTELSAAMDDTRRFGPDVIAVVNSGEETGKVPESLNHLADDYEEQVEYTVRNLGQLVQPLLMILLGGIVFFIILAVILPYISLLNNLAGAH